jgi:hypothetical protein
MTDDYIKMARADCECVAADLVEQIKERNARIAELEAALREAYEVYAGSDGFIPETAAEGYQQQLIKQMVDIIGAALEKKND